MALPVGGQRKAFQRTVETDSALSMRPDLTSYWRLRGHSDLDLPSKARFQRFLSKLSTALTSLLASMLQKHVEVIFFKHTVQKSSLQ